jgi:hypothetical protein
MIDEGSWFMKGHESVVADLFGAIVTSEQVMTDKG